MSFFNNLFGRDDDISSSVPEPEGESFSLDLDFNPQQQVFFAFIGTLVLGTLCAVAGVILMRPAPPAPPPIVERSPDFDIQTARESFAAAVELIRAEDPGAQLMSGTGIWYPTIDRLYLEAGRTGWTFHFYLPATAQMAEVVVDRGGAARISSVQDWSTPPDLLDEARWQIDSPVAVQGLIGNCSDVLAAPDAQVEARLSTAKTNITMMWNISAMSLSDPLLVCEVNVDAVSGLVR